MHSESSNPFLIRSPRFFAELLALPTPAIGYDFGRLRATARFLKQWSEGLGAVCSYAVKANRNRSILDELAKAGFGADVASEEELGRAVAADLAPICATSPGLNASAMQQVDRCGGIIYFDGIQQIREATHLGLRVQEHGVRVSMPGSYRHFGFSLAELACVESIPPRFHFHSGDVQNLSDLVQKLALISDVLDIYPVRSVNMGGGFGILSNSFSDFLAAGQILEDFSKRVGVTLTFEFGKVAVARCGALVTSVVAVKERDGLQTVVVDATSTVLGAWEQWKLSRVGLRQGLRRRSVVVGSSCYEGDIFSNLCELPILHVGDRLVMNNVGAYVASVGGSLHGRAAPPEFRLDHTVAVERI